MYIVSDIHLECQDENIDYTKMLEKPQHENSVLVCCGDICTVYMYNRLLNFFKYASNLYKYIIYVPGNCEYYKPKSCKKTLTFTKLNQLLDSISNTYNNVHVLINNSIIINDYLITGSILWSRINYDLPLHFRIAGFNKEIYNRKNKYCIQYIKEQIQYAKENSLKHVVITHYPPSKECLIDPGTNKKDKYKTMYYNNLDGLFDNKLTWIYGHCHNNKNFNISNTNLVCNQYGKNNFFDPNYSNKYYILI
jgi:predicted phosphohydrolase